jgi:hypothetical protein
MLNLFHIDLVVLSVRADPFDPHDAFFEIDGGDQPIVVPLNVEHNLVSRDDAGGSITALYIGCGRPLRLFEFIEPDIQGCLQRGMVFVSSS